MEATGEAGEIGRYDESEAVSDGPDELATLPLPFSAAGGRVKPPSNSGAFALLLPVISVEGCGVGGKLGRGISILDGLELTKQRLAAVKLLQKERHWSTEGLIDSRRVQKPTLSRTRCRVGSCRSRGSRATRARSQGCDWPISHMSLDCASNESAMTEAWALRVPGWLKRARG